MKCFQASMATSRISSLVMMQILKSFKPSCLKWSFCWILKGLWNSYKALIWRAELCLCRFQFASYCCLWLQIILISRLFLIRIVSSTTSGSVKLVHGFTHDKSAPYLFSTSQQQTEIVIHLLKKLAPVNDISGVLYLVDPMWIFPPRIWEEFQF